MNPHTRIQALQNIDVDNNEGRESRRSGSETYSFHEREQKEKMTVRFSRHQDLSVSHDSSVVDRGQDDDAWEVLE